MNIVILILTRCIILHTFNRYIMCVFHVCYNNLKLCKLPTKTFEIYSLFGYYDKLLFIPVFSFKPIYF